ncbi:MAG: hypothetical protein KIT73_08360 [Burkholderiales bacterium]|nr:hypothetical protein [Burkholderiales bacterium]
MARAHPIEKLTVARTRLVLDRPFLGALALHLDLRVAGDGVATLATDGRAVFCNPDWVDATSIDDLRFWLAHETLHCALGHPFRRGHRVRRRWDVACDHAVNLMLAEDGWTLPAEALAAAAFRGLTAEAIYPLVPDGSDEAPFDRHAFEHTDGGGGVAGYLGEQRLGDRPAAARTSPTAGDGGTPVDAGDDDSWDDAGSAPRRHRPTGAHHAEGVGRVDPATLEQMWKGRLAAAAQVAREAGRLGESWMRRLERVLEPPLPWRALLARYLLAVARDDYSFAKPSRREGPALLPGLHRGTARVVAVLDTSGSITEAELAAFVAELDALKGQIGARLIVHACDERLAPDGPWSFDPWEPVHLPDTVSGGGGTSFVPVFDWLADGAMPPDVLVYFTDGQGDFPPAAPSYPVVWLVKGPAPVPFGERIQLN